MSGLEQGRNGIYLDCANVPPPPICLEVFAYCMCRSDNQQQPIILKEARDSRSFNAEANALAGSLRGHSSFRQLVNLIPDRKVMVFEYLADNLHNVLYTRPGRKLQEDEVKRLTRVVLEGLVAMHAEGIAHTGMLCH